MCYILGLNIREKYKDSIFKEKEFNYNTLEAESSAYNRSLMSSNAFFVGLYGFNHLN